MSQDTPLLMRFFAKLVLDILPAALASMIGGLVLTHYQLGNAFWGTTAAEQAAPASVEMMQLLRDEHASIVEFLKAQMAAEKTRRAEEDRETRVVAEAKPAAAAPARRAVVAAGAPKRVASRTAPVPGAAPPAGPPIMIVQAEHDETVEPASRDTDSLLGKTMELKDRVVDATQRAVAAIGGIPSWIASIGDRIGGQRTTSSSAGPMFSASL